MNILFLNTTPNTGGAAIAASRIAKAINKKGVHTDFTYRPNGKISFIRFVIERLVIFLSNRFSKKNLFQVSIANTGIDISKIQKVEEADVIHLQWINQGFLSLSDIRKIIATGKPIVWTMHDLWPATGICHYPGNCHRYEDKCIKCPMQVDSPLFDLASKIFNKKKAIGLEKVYFVGCSKWITECAKTSSLLKDASFSSIPNPIDTSIYRPKEKFSARTQLGLPQDKFLIIFAAAKLSDNRKGANLFVKACKILKEQYISSERIEVVLMGNGVNELCKAIPFKVNILGYISEPSKMAAAYSSSDLFITPSLEDNLPNTIMEAMACGTPCVGFNVGGIPEMIDHLKNGYVAKYKDVNDLAAGIEWVIENRETMHLSEACVKKVKENYTEEIVADKYIELYKSLLQNH